MNQSKNRSNSIFIFLRDGIIAKKIAKKQLIVQICKKYCLFSVIIQIINDSLSLNWIKQSPPKG